MIGKGKFSEQLCGQFLLDSFLDYCGIFVDSFLVDNFRAVFGDRFWDKLWEQLWRHLLGQF